MSSDKYDYIFKIYTFGGTYVDKTEFILKFTNDSYITYFPTSYATIGVFLVQKIIDFENKCIQLLISDSCGEERFRGLTKSQLKGAHGVIFIYDITKKYSFENIRNWVKDTELIADKSLKRVLIGNKCDEPNREVSEEDGKQFADKHNIGFFETYS